MTNSHRLLFILLLGLASPGFGASLFGKFAGVTEKGTPCTATVTSAGRFLFFRKVRLQIFEEGRLVQAMTGDVSVDTPEELTASFVRDSYFGTYVVGSIRYDEKHDDYDISIVSRGNRFTPTKEIRCERATR